MKGLTNIYRRFLSILSARVVTTMIAFISTPIIVRLLGPGGYGDYAVLLSIFSLYMIPVSSGITSGVQKFVAENRSDEYWREQIIRFYALLAFAIVLVGVTVLLVFTALGGAATIFGEDFTLYFYLLCVLIFITQFHSLAYRALLGMSLEVLSGPLEIATKFLTVTVGILLVFVGYGVEGMIAGQIVAYTLIACLAGYWILRQVSVSAMIFGSMESVPYRNVMSFNALNIVLILLVMSLFHVDIIMLRILSDPETTGFYKAALALAEYLWIVPIVLKTILLHSSSTLWSENQTAKITSMSTRVTRYTLLLVILMAIGIAVLANRFVPIYYGEEFSVAVGPLLLLLPGAIGFAAARPLKAISQGSGRMKVLIVATGIAAVGNFLLNAALIPIFGMHGAAVATSLSYGSMFGLLVWAAWRIGYNPVAELRTPRIVATAILVTPVIFSTNALIGHDIIALLVVPPVGAIFYLAFAIGTGAIGKAELDTLAEALPDPLGAVLGASTSWISR